MPTKAAYTTTDSFGSTVQKGDQVTLTMTGEVRSVSRDGIVVIRMSDGTVTAFYPSYQAMQKRH